MKELLARFLAGVFGLTWVISAGAQPVITVQPQNQTNILSSSVTFSVIVTGAPPISYQWRYYTSATVYSTIPGATDATMTLTNVQPVAGRFAVAVWNAGGTNVSRLVSLKVLLPATIVQQPTNLVLFSAMHATFRSAVTGEPPLRLQWYFKQVPLPHETNSSLTIFGVHRTNEGGYSLLASNFLGSITSQVATLTLLVPTNGQNIKLGDDSPLLPTNLLAQAEAHITRSFTDPNLVVVAMQEGRYTDGAALDCGYAVSHDAGQTWSRGLILGLTTLTGGPFDRGTDPVAAIDHKGDIYLGTFAFNSSLEAMMISKSTNGGASFSPPVQAVSNAGSDYKLDKNWLAVNTFAGTPTAGRLVLSWTQIFNPGLLDDNSIRSNGVVVSDDGGRNWSRPRFVGSPRCQATQPLFLPDGSLAMPSWNFDLHGIEMVVSEDGGTTFGTPRAVAVVQRYDDPVARAVGFVFSATTDRMAGVVYLSWQGLLGPTNAGRPSIFFSKSIDKGRTWSSPIAVNDTPNSRSVLIPGIAASPDGQHVTIVFYDKRNDPGQGYFVDLYLAESFDGGQTWEPNSRVSDVSSDLRRAPLTSLGYMLGDYQAIVPALDFNTPAVACWIDTRNATPDPYIVRLDRRRGTTFDIWRTLRFSTNELADASISGPDADPDGDGIRNLAEYAHGLEPRRADPPSIVSVGRDNSPLELGAEPVPTVALTFDTPAALGDIEFAWETSTDLVHWSPAVPERQTTNATIKSTFLETKARFRTGVSPARNFRLKLDQTRP